MALPERGARLSQRAPPNSTTAYALDAQRPKEGLGFRVRTPKDAEVQNEALERTAQIWPYVGSFAFIWIAIAGLAFSDDSGLHQFIVLGIGGGVSALLAVVFVEAQTVRRGVNAISMHDYLLGTGFFFAGVGGLWGARAIVGLLVAFGSIEHLPSPRHLRRNRSMGRALAPGSSGDLRHRGCLLRARDVGALVSRIGCRA